MESQSKATVEIIQMFQDEFKRFQKSNSLRPFVLLSYSQSFDGYLGLQDQTTRISSSESLEVTHRLRQECDAILVGVNTILVDNPRLTVRLKSGARRNPTPVILDSKLRTPLTCKIIAQYLENPNVYRKPIIFHSCSDMDLVESFTSRGLTLIKFQSDDHVTRLKQDVSFKLKSLGINSIMVEGGAFILSEFFKARLSDLCIVTTGSKLLGKGNRIKDIPETNIKFVQSFSVGPDQINCFQCNDQYSNHQSRALD